MTIKRRLRLTGVILISFSLLFVACLLFSMSLVNRAAEKAKISGQIARGAAQLSYLAQAYTSRPEERVKKQWLERYGSLAGLLLQSSNLFDEEVLAVLREKQAGASRIFDELVAGYQSQGSVPAEFTSLRQQSRERLVTQLIAKTQDMQYEAYVLQAKSAKEIDDIQRWSFFVMLGLFTLLMLILVSSFARLYKGIMNPLHDLEGATGQIAAGHLDFQAVETDDEVGRLAHAFNKMGRSLKESYAKLSREVAERRKAQAALEKARDELEDRVEMRTADLATRTRQLEEANKELESFSYSVSHDLRAPLRAIDGFVAMLEKDLQGVIEGETKRKFETIQRNAKTMGTLIDDLLAFSRLGRAALSPSLVDMGGLVGEVVEEQKALNDGRSLDITVNGLPAARGDRNLLRQVFVNLVSNAVKFTRPKEKGIIEIHGDEGDDENIYYVKDNGVGFDMEYSDKLFGVFQRLHSVREFEGTGVGLAIVQRIVHRHGGRVWAEGKVGEGATLYFSLPKGGHNDK